MVNITKAQAAVIYDILTDSRIRTELLKASESYAQAWTEVHEGTAPSTEVTQARWLAEVESIIETLDPVVCEETFNFIDTTSEVE